DGVKVWRGECVSNELNIAIRDSPNPDRSEMEIIRGEIDRHVQQFQQGTEFVRNRASYHLMLLSHFSLPILVEQLRHPDARVRRYSVATLGGLANEQLAL